MSSSVDLSYYHLTFDAEMTTSADMSLFRNSYVNGDRTIYGNYESEYYADYNPASPSNPFSFANGALTITASPTPQGGLPYTSGLLSTADTFTQNTGYFEIRAEVPDSAGFWSAFWMLTPDYSSEIDVLEQPNNDGPTNYYTSVKTPGFNFGAFNNSGVDGSTGYHTYGFMWTPYAVQFTFDGQYIGYSIPIPSGLASARPYLLANLAVGGSGSWPGAPGTDASAQLKIDYIRAYSSDPTLPGITPEAVSTPDAFDMPSLPTIGTGSDALVLQINEDAYQGDAQFTVTVDGVQQGGVMTSSASKSLNQTQALTINGNFSTGSHTVSVNFLNDAYAAGVGDRNLFVAQATLDGAAIFGSTLTLFNAGPAGFSFTGSVVYPTTTVLGSGPDLLALQVSEDAYQGDAQFTISVDGKQYGGTQTTTAVHAAGSTQAFDILGSFGAGTHSVSVNFLNDGYGGSASLDRNLYVTQASFDNSTVSGSSLNEYSGGAQAFSFQVPSVAAAKASAASTASPTVLTLHMAEDAYLGDAQFIVTVDGQQLGGTQSVSANHSQNGSQAFSFADVLAAGTHDVAVSFTNDLYGGGGYDRNLFVAGADQNGTALNATAWMANLYSNGTAHFNLVVPS